MTRPTDIQLAAREDDEDVEEEVETFERDDNGDGEEDDEEVDMTDDRDGDEPNANIAMTTTTTTTTESVEEVVRGEKRSSSALFSLSLSFFVCLFFVHGLISIMCRYVELLLSPIKFQTSPFAFMFNLPMCTCLSGLLGSC